MMKHVKLLLLGLFAFAALLAVSFSQPVEALSTGPFLERTAAPEEQNCTACHRTYQLDSGPGRVSIEGLPSQYAPGQTYPVTVRLSDPAANIWGFQITSITDQGTAAGFFQSNTVAIAALGPSQRLGRFYAQHTANGTYGGSRGEVAWSFFWKAPSTDLGPVSFYAAGNAGNGDHTDFYDYIYTTNVTIDGLRRLVRIKLESPAAATGLGSGERVVVRWSATDGDTAVPDHFRVLLSTDGGENYPTVLADNLPSTARSFVWTIPEALVTPYARIRVVVVDSEGNERTDQSRTDISIGPLGLTAATGVADAPLGGEFTRQAWADVNGDGRQDVVVGRNAGGVLLYVQNADGSFAEVTDETGLTMPGDVRALAWGDADGDGHPDLAVLGVNTTSLWRNNGDGTFDSVGAPTSFPRQADPRAVVWTDVDRDGRLDVVAGGQSGLFALHNTEGGFEDATSAWNAPAGPVTGIAAGPKLLVASGSSLKVIGFDGGRFLDETGAVGDPVAFGACAVAWADLTGDGWLDIVASGASGNAVFAGVEGELRYRNATAELSLASLAGGSRVLPADFDTDGDVDLLVFDIAGAAHVLRNRGVSGFDDVSGRFSFTGEVTSAAWVDHDGGGAVELSLTTSDGLGVMANPRSGAGSIRVRPLTDLDSDAHAADAEPDRDAIGAVVRVDLDGDGDWITGPKIAIVVEQSASPVVVIGATLESATVRVDFADGEGREVTIESGAQPVEVLDPDAPRVVSARPSSTGKKLTVDGIGLPATGGRILVGSSALASVKAPARFVGSDGTSTRLVGKDSRLSLLLQTKPVAVRIEFAGVFSAPVVLR